MAEHDALSLFVELDHAELECVAFSNRALVLFSEMTAGAETFYAILECYNGTLVAEFNDLTFNECVNAEFSFKLFPRILLELLVAKAETTVLFVDFEHDNLDFSTDRGELVRVFDFLGPAQIADVDQAVNAFFDLNEYAEVGEVTNFSPVACANCVLLSNVLPWIGFELFDTERHLALVAVESEDNSVHFVTDFEEVVSGTEVLAPAHFTYVNQTFYAVSDLNECSVVCHNDNLTVHFVTNFEVSVELLPRMRSELFETESDAFLLFVEVKDNDVDLLVELNDFFRIGYAAPAQVSDVNKTIYATEVNEDAVVSDVLNHTFENLTFLET